MEVIIDDRLNFKEHVKYIGEKACTGEDDAKYWRTRSIQKEDNFDGSNDDNSVWSEALSVWRTRRILSSLKFF